MKQDAVEQRVGADDRTGRTIGSGAFAAQPGVGPTKRWIVRTARMLGVAMTAFLLAESAALAKVAPTTLGGPGKPVQFRRGRPGRSPRAMDESRWSGRAVHRQPFCKVGRVSGKGWSHSWPRLTWACDISEAKPGEEAVVFIEGDRPGVCGPGKDAYLQPCRASRSLPFGPDVHLPLNVVTEAGPESEYPFIRGISLDELAAAVRAVVSKNRRGGMKQPPNNGMKLTGSAMPKLPRPLQLIPVLDRPWSMDRMEKQSRMRPH